MTTAPSPDLTDRRQGNYAGAVSRLAAFALDIGISWGLFTLGAAAFTFAIRLLTGKSVSLNNYKWLSVAVLASWEFLYFFYQWGLAGRTIGMATLGVQVVKADGTPIGWGSAFWRTLTFPLSFLLFGLGFLGIIVNRHRQAWHDRFAKTAVVYSWDARAARLRWLAKSTPATPGPATATGGTGPTPARRT